nr:MAG TPA: hypothetical protein [Caudoviricetes sp.]
MRLRVLSLLVLPLLVLPLWERGINYLSFLVIVIENDQEPITIINLIFILSPPSFEVL